MKTKPSTFVYILPNLFTAASIFVAVLSMVSSLEGDFVKAAWFIMLSLIFDGLDGRVARLTNTCSKFGVEFDSLADIVAFGVAPALLIYMFVGHEFGRFGVVVSAMFIILGAIRLARFNIMTTNIEPSVFIGVPIPTAAVFVSLLVLLFDKYNLASTFGIFILFASVLVSILMVSNIRYPSFKKINFQPQHKMKFFISLLVLSLSLFMFPVEGFTLLFFLYLIYGVARAFKLFSRILMFKK